jgi:hypothetical protein
MANIQIEVYEAFRLIDVPEAKALAAAGALAKREIGFTGLRSDLKLVKLMLGFVLALQIAIVIKLFTQ